MLENIDNQTKHLNNFPELANKSKNATPPMLEHSQIVNTLCYLANQQPPSSNL